MVNYRDKCEFIYHTDLKADVPIFCKSRYIARALVDKVICMSQLTLNPLAPMFLLPPAIA